MLSTKVATVVAAIAAMSFASQAAAATVTPIQSNGSFVGDFNSIDSGTFQGTGFNSGGFHFASDGATLGSSGAGPANCQLFNDRCVKIDAGKSMTMTLIGGGSFNLTQFSFMFGNYEPYLSVSSGGSNMILTADFDGVASRTCDPAADFCVDKKTWLLADLEGEGDGVTEIVFKNNGEHVLRIGGISASPTNNERIPAISAVPLPASGLLLIGGLGGLFASRRRRKAA